MMNPPKTIPNLGIKFIQALAKVAGPGDFLDIEPLYGASTLAMGLAQPEAQIQVASSFIAPPALEKKLQLKLNDDVFSKFTKPVKNLTTTQLTSTLPNFGSESRSLICLPVQPSAKKMRQWLEHLEPIITDSTILVGPGIVGRNSNQLAPLREFAEKFGSQLSILGQVWAFGAGDKGQKFVHKAVDTVVPKLRGFTFLSDQGNGLKETQAAVWTSGLHGNRTLRELKLQTPNNKEVMQISLLSKGKLVRSETLPGASIGFKRVDTMAYSLTGKFAFQLCWLNQNGRSETSKLYDNHGTINLGDVSVTSIRLLCE